MASLKYNNYLNEYLKADAYVSEEDLLTEDCLEDDLFFEELLNTIELREQANFFKRREYFH